MSEGRLPKWRYWPGVPFAALVLIAIIGLVEQPQGSQQEQASKAPDSYVDSRTPDERIADYTLWLERLTGLLAISTIGLWWVTWRTLTHAEQSSERQLRAYIGVSVEMPEIKDNIITVILTTKNWGQTPAYELAYRFECRPFRSPITYKEILQIERPLAISPVLQPDRSIEQAIAYEFSKGELAVIRKGAGTFLYLWGVVRYRDAFKADRVTPLLCVLAPDDLHGLTGRFVYCPEGNEAT